MKKFFITLLLLIILAAAGLFFGWAQMGVPPDSYGLIRSKTHGVNPRLVVPGEFNWLWYKLIPTNAVTTVLRLNTVTHSFPAQNVLPLAQTYAAFAGITDVFSWKFNGSFSFTLQPEALVTLVTTYNIGNQEELARYEQEVAGKIEAFILRRVNSGENYPELIEALLKNGTDSAFEQEVEREFAQITHFSLQATSVNIPDFVVYRQIKEVYEAYIALQKEYISGELSNKAQNQVEAFRRFDELEQYGQLLTKYPVLLEYLKMESDKKPAPEDQE